MSGARQIAFLLFRHARWMMPENRAAWAEGMAREARYVGNDREVLSWAIGCVLASYAARLRAEEFLLPRIVRLLLAVWCLQFPFLYVSQLPFRLAECGSADLCSHQFLALNILRGLAACCYLLAGLRLACNRQTALLPYVAALTLTFVTMGYMAVMPQNGEGAHFLGLVPGAEFETGYLRIAVSGLGARLWFAVILPLLFAAPIWLMDHYSDGAPTARKLV